MLHHSKFLRLRTGEDLQAVACCTVLRLRSRSSERALVDYHRVPLCRDDASNRGVIQFGQSSYLRRIFAPAWRQAQPVPARKYLWENQGSSRSWNWSPPAPRELASQLLEHLDLPTRHKRQLPDPQAQL